MKYLTVLVLAVGMTGLSGVGSSTRAGDVAADTLHGVLTPAMLGQADAAVAKPSAEVKPGVADAAVTPWQPSDFFKSLTWKGYAQTSYTFNFGRPKTAAGNENIGRIFDLHSNEFMLNAVEFVLEKPVDEQNPVGFVFNPLLGQTAPVIHSGGFFAGEDLDLVQAFIQVMIPETKTKIMAGKFITAAGSEVIYSPANDQFSRSLLFGFAIPFTHTGIMAFQPILKQADGTTDMLTLFAGLANGWDLVKDNNESKMVHVGSTLSPCPEFSVTGNMFYSFSEQAGNEENGRTLLDFVSTIYPLKGQGNEDLDNVKLLLNVDWAGEEGAAGDGAYGAWWGFAGGLRYDFSFTGEERTWFVAGRGEYFNDEDGSRTTGIGAPASGVSIYEVTFTLGWRPVSYLQLRSEFRYDKADEDIFFHRSGAGGTGTVGDENHQETLAFDAMFIF